MYVCICKAVTDRQISQAVADGVSSMRELRMTLGVASCCGKCAPDARALLLEGLARRKESERQVIWLTTAA
ncbi:MULTISPECIES: bacterioferritin-associated ferredoxin [Leeia]|uniref:Bacterioferritin-associated ferredoxin n=1 Tax=Leeia aquatica TaxID=2725557 RepID=A0A847S257_9NEIS|nr:bacterioferritin-associated ferredoxin [Leeia aquatica]NLR73843.1 (2Fe-2S)-binding protein [Leeia aquatica]